MNRISQGGSNIATAVFILPSSTPHCTLSRNTTEAPQVLPFVVIILSFSLGPTPPPPLPPTTKKKNPPFFLHSGRDFNQSSTKKKHILTFLHELHITGCQAFSNLCESNIATAVFPLPSSTTCCTLSRNTIEAPKVLQFVLLPPFSSGTPPPPPPHHPHTLFLLHTWVGILINLSTKKKHILIFLIQKKCCY